MLCKLQAPQNSGIDDHVAVVELLEDKMLIIVLLHKSHSLGRREPMCFLESVPLLHLGRFIKLVENIVQKSSNS